MSESSNSGVLSRALLLPLRRISLISSSREVGSFAMIPEKNKTKQNNIPCQVACYKEHAFERVRVLWFGCGLDRLSTVSWAERGSPQYNSTEKCGGLEGWGLPCSDTYLPPRLMLETLFKLSESLTHKKGIKIGGKKKGFCRRKEDEIGKWGVKRTKIYTV